MIKVRRPRLPHVSSKRNLENGPRRLGTQMTHGGLPPRPLLSSSHCRVVWERHSVFSKQPQDNLILCQSLWHKQEIMCPKNTSGSFLMASMSLFPKQRVVFFFKQLGKKASLSLHQRVKGMGKSSADGREHS